MDRRFALSLPIRKHTLLERKTYEGTYLRGKMTGIIIFRRGDQKAGFPCKNMQ